MKVVLKKTPFFLENISSENSKHKYGRYICFCGKEFIGRKDRIKIGKKRSCGCLNHKLSKTNEYKIWVAMRSRCSCVTGSSYKNYGGRGIRVCERWNSFTNFLSDMGPRPSKNHSIDRINNDGNYEPSNCRWATWKEQQSNRRTSYKILYGGWVFSFNDMCILENVDSGTMSRRLKSLKYIILSGGRSS